MSELIATADELGVYLGDDAINTARAEQMLRLSQDLCETVVNPLPVQGKAVLLAVAARAYNNVTAAHRVTIGTAEVSYGTQYSSSGIGGLFLARPEKATLRRLAGRGGAYTIDPLPLPLPPEVVPDVSFLSPAGAVTGELVTINGTGFQSTVAVTFGGVAATEWSEVSDTELVVVVPAGAAGVVAVVVTNGIGPSNPVSYQRGGLATAGAITILDGGAP